LSDIIKKKSFVYSGYLHGEKSLHIQTPSVFVEVWEIRGFRQKNPPNLEQDVNSSTLA